MTMTNVLVCSSTLGISELVDAITYYQQSGQTTVTTKFFMEITHVLVIPKCPFVPVTEETKKDLRKTKSGWVKKKENSGRRV